MCPRRDLTCKKHLIPCHIECSAGMWRTFHVDIIHPPNDSCCNAILISPKRHVHCRSIVRRICTGSLMVECFMHLHPALPVSFPPEKALRGRVVPSTSDTCSETPSTLLSSSNTLWSLHYFGGFVDCGKLVCASLIQLQSYSRCRHGIMLRLCLIIRHSSSPSKMAFSPTTSS